MKLAGDTFWDPRKYLNIYIHPDQEGRGSANLPKVYASFPLDGLLTVPDNCQCDPDDEFFQSCKIDTNNALSSSGLIHEVGHSLGLMHVFSHDNCNSSDYCTDTYSYSYNSREPCSDNQGTDDYDNFMDYIGDYTTFTYEQRERIQHVFEYGLWLNELKNSNQ